MKRLLENALNRYLELDCQSKQRMAPLQDKIVTIQLLKTPLTVQLIFIDDKIQLQWDHFLKADLTIKGSPLNLLQAGLVRSERPRIFAEEVEIEGDMELAQPVLAIFDELEIDWEEKLSQWLGDVPAYQSSRFLLKLKSLSQRVRKTTLQNVNEYVHEEINLFPPAEALRQFFHEVDELRMIVDRLEARVEKIGKQQ